MQDWAFDPDFIEAKRIHEAEHERPERRIRAQARMIDIQTGYVEAREGREVAASH